MEEGSTHEVGMEVVDSAPHRHRPRKSKLYSDIRTQMEFYFSDANLTKQRVMREIVQQAEYVPLITFVEKFNKLSQLTKNSEDVRRALKKSEKLEVSEDGTGVKRKIPFDESKTKDESTVENCTIYVENIPLHADHTWVEKIFQEFGQIAYVSLPKFKRSKQPKGFAFVEFEDEDAAKRCLEAFGEMGACLPTNIEPSALLSITTYNEEQKDSGPATNLRKRRRGHGGETSSSVDEVIGKRKKNSDDNTNAAETAKSSTPIKQEKMDEDCSKMSTSSTPVLTEIKQKLQKRKADSKDSDHESGAEVGTNTTQTTTTTETKSGKKKKRRKHKTQERREDRLESDLIHLKILPKQNWRQLRNRYLNLQRENFGKLKRQLRASKFSFIPEQTPSGQYKSVCIKIGLSSPESRKEIVSKITPEEGPPEWSSFVKYIDYEDNNGTEVIVRMTGSPAAATVIPSFLETANKIFQTARIMSGTETDEYWAATRSKLKEKKKQNVRGKDQLLNKVTKLAASHIHFDNNDEEERAM